ncbi:hypothetical protein ACQP2U_27955 [Nocardia sp. CA-084685]
MRNSNAAVEYPCAAGDYGTRMVEGGFGGSIIAVFDADRTE